MMGRVLICASRKQQASSFASAAAAAAGFGLERKKKKVITGCGALLTSTAHIRKFSFSCVDVTGLLLPSSSAASHFQQQQQQRLHHQRLFSSEAAQHVAACGGIVEVPLAQTGEGIADCELLTWFIREGDEVEEFQPLCQVQSDKATIEITSRYKGKITQLNFVPGDIVKVGETLVEIMVASPSAASSSSDSDKEDNPIASSQQDGTKPATVNVGASNSSGEEKIKVAATPAVRDLARRHGINLAHVVGTGECGRVLKEDIIQLVSSRQVIHEDASPITRSLPSPAPTTTATRGNRMPHEDTVLPIRGFQRTMVKAMTAAAAVPHFHYMEDINMNSLVKLKKSLQDHVGSGVKLTYLPFLIKALSLALDKYPMLNSTVNDDASEITRKGPHNVGVAIATPSGLVVPNIKGVHNLCVEEIAKEILRLSKLAAENKLSIEDVSNGTITVSNFGAIGGRFGSPVLHLPEVAILGFGRIQKVPRFDDAGCVYPASVMSVTWGADHRVIDGATVANICNEWKFLTEQPERWLLHLR